MNTLANQPAFPVSSESGNTPFTPSPGMILRQYYAGKALQGLLACPAVPGSVEDFARNAVKYADALIAELEKTK